MRGLLGTGNRVLVVGEDALTLCDADGVLATADPGSDAALAGLGQHLRRHRGPVLLLLDTLDQFYRREPVARVGLLDRAKVLARRIAQAMPDVEVRGALPLTDTDDPAGRPHLFVGLAEDDLLRRVIATVHEARCTVAGVSLLPLEGAGMLRDLARSLAGEGRPLEGRWTLYIARHAGGIRQIVTRDGDLALTRLTPPPPSEEDEERLAAELAQEVQSSISYLGRQGYTPAEGIDIVLIGPESLGEALGARGPLVRSVVALSARDLAERLKLRADLRRLPAAGAWGQRVEGLIGAWAQGRRPRLALMPPILRRQYQVKRVTGWALAVLLLAVVGLAVDLTLLRHQQYLDRDSIAALRVQQAAYGETLTIRRDHIAAYPMAVEDLAALLRVADEVAARRRLPDPDLAALATALGEQIRADRVTWILPERPTARRGQPRPPQPPPVLTVRLDLTMVEDIGLAVRAVEAVAARLRVLFPDRSVEILQQVASLLPGQSLVGAGGTVVAPSRAPDRRAELRIGESPR